MNAGVSIIGEERKYEVLNQLMDLLFEKDNLMASEVGLDYFICGETEPGPDSVAKSTSKIYTSLEKKAVVEVRQIERPGYTLYNNRIIIRATTSKSIEDIRTSIEDYIGGKLTEEK